VRLRGSFNQAETRGAALADMTRVDIERSGMKSNLLIALPRA